MLKKLCGHPVMSVRVPLSTSRFNVSRHLSKAGIILSVSLTVRVFPTIYIYKKCICMYIKPGLHNNIYSYKKLTKTNNVCICVPVAIDK